MAKKIFCVFCLVITGLFYFQSWAMAVSLEDCNRVFERAYDNGISLNTSVHLSEGRVLEAVSKKISAQLLLSRIPHTDSKEPPYLRRLSTSWKYQVMEVLPRFEVFQLFSLFDKMVIIKDQLDLNHEKDFFKSLETASISHLADFNKKQLMDIIWVFVQLGITPPSEEFVSAWRESAMTKRRKFSAQDRYGLHGFFRQLEITPLSYPY